MDVFPRRTCPDSRYTAALIVAAFATSANCLAQTAAIALPARDDPRARRLPRTAHLLIDVTSGQTLAAVNAEERRDPASLTKLMTAYVVFGALRAKTIVPSQMVNVSRTRAWRAEGSRMFIEPRRAVTVDELLRGMIIQSGNDASIALAELVAGSEEAFVARMNAEAARLNMTEHAFHERDGAVGAGTLFDRRRSGASSRARVISDYPEFYPLYSLKEFRYNNITQPNRNRLLWIDPSVDGVKTGHTEAAGWCLIASAKHGERRVLSVVLGANSDAARASEARSFSTGASRHSTRCSSTSRARRCRRCASGRAPHKEVPAGFLADRYLTLPKGKADKLALTLEAQEPLVAPIARAQRVGTVKVALDGKPVAEFPLIALEEVPAAGIFGRAWDTIRLWFKH